MEEIVLLNALAEPVETVEIPDQDKESGARYDVVKRVRPGRPEPTWDWWSRNGDTNQFISDGPGGNASHRGVVAWTLKPK